mmetsp:Transcript_1559/g.4164  ORF Transcript_1559/g.4164 Transcript_1559/m.4164 type:complete len:95 (+) Transcript_1559:155-439(+)
MARARNVPADEVSHRPQRQRSIGRRAGHGARHGARHGHRRATPALVATEVGNILNGRGSAPVALSVRLIMEPASFFCKKKIGAVRCNQVAAFLR